MAADGRGELGPSCALKLSANARADGDIPWGPPVSMVEMEADAALVLANFAQIAFLEKENSGRRGFRERDVGSEKEQEFGPPAGDSKSKTCFSAHRARISLSGDDEGDGDKGTGCEASGCPSGTLFSLGIREKQEPTEAEQEAKRMRRVLANRESARQTIFRRQARFEELSKRAAELLLENEQIKAEKARLAEEYSALRDTNARLKEQVAALKFENEEDHLPGISASIKRESPTCSSVIGPSATVNGNFPSAELEISKLFCFNGGGTRSVQSSGALGPMFPWLLPVYCAPPPWTAHSAPAVASYRLETAINRNSVYSKSAEDFFKDKGRSSRSENEAQRPRRGVGKLVEASVATEARKKRKELARRGRRC